METLYMTTAFDIQEILNGDSVLLPSKFTLVKFEDYLISKYISSANDVDEDELQELISEFVTLVQKRNKKTQDTIVPIFEKLDDDVNELVLTYSLSDFDRNKNYVKDRVKVTLKEIIDNFSNKVLMSDIPTLTATSYDFGVLFR